jgi:hypothetical protein
MDPIKAGTQKVVPAAPPAAAAPATAGGGATQASAARPSVPPDVPQFFIPTRGSAGGSLIYKPFLVGSARVNFVDSKSKVDLTTDVLQMTAITDAAVPVDWAQAMDEEVAVNDLEREPGDGATFVELPSAAAKPKNYEKWSKDFVTWLYGSQTVELFKSAKTKQVSNVDESERDFRLRLTQSGREQRDAEVEKLRQKYAPKIATLQERLRKAQQAVEAEKEQAKQQGMQTAISVGATLLGAFVGRKGSSIGRATTAVRGASRSMKEQADIGRAEDTVEAVAAQLKTLDEEFRTKSAELESALDAQGETLETVTIKPKKTAINVQLVALAWAPYWKKEDGSLSEAWRQR